ncbi:hypothetical protein PFISCL1PPCAC_7239, partial [Pristionchus fissidentatus]
FQTHMRSHTGERPYKCEKCNLSFKYRSGVEQHRKKAHSSLKAVNVILKESCVNHLQAHERTHTRDRPFKCDHCGSRFLTNSKFKEHERTHTGERPFKCEECGLTFARANTLK